MRRSMLLFVSFCLIIFTVFSLQAQESDIVINSSDSDTFGSFLVNADGQTLYTTSEDCTGDCLSVWLPVTASSADTTVTSEGIAGTFSTITTDAGDVQLAYNRQALYTLNGEAVGDVTGVSDIWSLVYPQTLALSGTDDLGSFFDHTSR